MKLSNKKTNKGRSMIEMLGVLALMAILSLVGVYMLQRSMLVHRTNQLVEDMRLAGMVVLDGLYDDLTTEEMSIKGHFEQQTPYNFAAAMESDTLNTFYVIAKGVPFDVCIEVKKRKPQWAEQIVANDEQDTCLENQDNDMGFFFNDELTDLLDGCTKDTDCGECGKCKNNRCSYGFKNQSGSCFDCSDSTSIIKNVDKKECHKCKNRMWSTYNGGRCVTLFVPGSNYAGGITEEECEKFPNHYSARGGNLDCFYCSGTFDKTTGVCSTTDCNVNYNLVNNGIYGLSKEDCEQCGGSHSHNTYTPEDQSGSYRVNWCWFGS